MSLTNLTKTAIAYSVGFAMIAIVAVNGAMKYAVL